MIREPVTQIPNESYGETALILESAKECQEWDKFLPATKDIPTTHEQYVVNEVIERNGAQLTMKRIGVRRKMAEQGKPVVEPDNLNELDEEALDDPAAKAGVTIDAKFRNKSKAQKVAMIREARAKSAKAT